MHRRRQLLLSVSLALVAALLGACVQTAPPNEVPEVLITSLSEG